jgi:hypothetical protein
VDRVAPTFAELGLPEDRGYVTMDLGGTHAPGAELGFTIGLHAGVAAIHRRFAWVLAVDGRELAREEARVGAISARRPVRLAVRLPDDAPADYRLALEIDGRALEWPVRVPEQRIEARFVCVPDRVRRGDRLTATLHNTGPSELFFGASFGIERREGERWTSVDPFDGDESIAWPAIGYGLRRGGESELIIDVPRLTEPGLHRVVKCVSACGAGVLEAWVTAEFTVEA